MEETSLSTAQSEYKKFLSLYSHKLNGYEIKLAKIILENFSKIESTSSARGNRGKLITKLIEQHGDEVSEELNFDKTTMENYEEEIISLSSITIENFRGFSDKNIFEFKNPYTFVYGPNGTGKSSLCEALEYSLLGTIDEAQNKRIEVTDYIKNIYSKKGQPPLLVGINQLNENVEISPNSSKYGFCFIERNRIEGFARIAANTRQSQQQRLAILFGLEGFNEFVTNFNETIDSYLDCRGKKTEELAQKEKQIEIHKMEIERIALQQKNINKQEEELLESYPGVEKIKDLKEIISSDGPVLGLIQRNNKEIAELSTLKYKKDPGIEQIKNLNDDIQKDIDKYYLLQGQIKKYKADLSLKDLYTSILKYRDSYTNNCPACESELYIDNQLMVPKDPYLNAEKGIAELTQVISLEESIENLESQIHSKVQSLTNQFSQIVSIAEIIDFAEFDVITALNEGLIKCNRKIENILDTVGTLCYHNKTITKLKADLAEYNGKVRAVESKIETLRNKNKEYEKTLEDISEISANYKSVVESEKTSSEAIESFNKENINLIKQVQEEKLIVSKNQKYSESYKSFKTKLEKYNESLPASLVKDLSSNTLKFYNLINRNDYEYDLLENIYLPQNAGEKMKITFKDGNECDALHVLSEGHLRCLGLAILLAKNVGDKLPFIIFDDVVNAIDDEHRRGIIATLFEDPEISKKQLIITTHGEEFVKDLENNIPTKEYPNKVTRIDFLKFEELNKINVKLDNPRNYLVIAHNKLIENQYRDCLANCRRALENILYRLWKKVGRKYNIQVTVQLRTPESKPDLMGTAQALNKIIKKQTNGEFLEVSTILEELIGEKHKHRTEWNYLNKGTHDEERVSEFDQTVVKDIMSLLEAMDDKVMQ
jgi:DNA repair exonuclease SbcCD ATPase subunit